MPQKKNEETAIDKFIENNTKKYNIPKLTLKALKDFGIYDARVLCVLTESEIAAIPNISEKTAISLVNAADDNFRGPLFQKAVDQSERLLKKRKYFTTGSKNLDGLLGGGMPTSAIVEINGEYRSGKTQTCLTCCVTAQLPEELGGLGRPVIYIDTENSFQAQHLQEIGIRFNVNPEQLLNNIFVVQAEQLRYLNQTIDRLPGYVQALDPGLIIIDSLIAPFRSEFHELNLLAVRQKKLGKLIGLLKRIAIAFNTSVIFTNQVMANIGPSAQFIPMIATGGHVLAHASDIRITMKKLTGNGRRAKIDDCAWLPNAQADLFVTSAGINDNEDNSSKHIVETDEINTNVKDDSAKEINTSLKDGIDEANKHTQKKKQKNNVRKNESPINDETSSQQENLSSIPLTNEEKNIETDVIDRDEYPINIDEVEPSNKSNNSEKKSKIPA